MMPTVASSPASGETTPDAASHTQMTKKNSKSMFVCIKKWLSRLLLGPWKSSSNVTINASVMENFSSSGFSQCLGSKNVSLSGTSRSNRFGFVAHKKDATRVDRSLLDYNLFALPVLGFSLGCFLLPWPCLVLPPPRPSNDGFLNSLTSISCMQYLCLASYKDIDFVTDMAT